MENGATISKFKQLDFVLTLWKHGLNQLNQSFLISLENLSDNDKLLIPLGFDKLAKIGINLRISKPQILISTSPRPISDISPAKR